jgi:hypothetical protein
MDAIVLDDPDGRAALPICRANREWVVSRYRDFSMIALWFFRDDLPIAEADRATDQKAMRHLRSCPKCRNWLHFVVPEDVLQRQYRLTRYCCAGMFVALEESDAPNRVSFELFRGEDPCWMIDGYRSFASFCPWCGSKLPNKPFIDEA